MTNNIAKIRAALRSHLPMSREQQEALAALAKLEKSRTPEQAQKDYEHFLSYANFDDTPQLRYAYFHGADADAGDMPPPVPVAEIREVVVTDETCQRVAASFYGADTFANGVEMHEVLQLWRKELGPALGLETQRHRDNEIDALEQKLARADARIAELERECLQWGVEMRIYRETENKRIAELEQSVTVRDTEIARLETDLELARRDVDHLRLFARIRFGYAPGDYFCTCHCCKSQFIGDKRAMNCEACADKAIDAARAGNGGEG